MVARNKGGQASKRHNTSRSKWSWIGTHRQGRVRATVEEAPVQPRTPRFQLGQSNGSAGFPSSWGEPRMDKHINICCGNGKHYLVEEGVESGYRNSNGIRSMNSGMFLQVAQQGYNEAQRILEQNRVLIQEIDQNKENNDKDGLTRNAYLIKELNINIAHLVDLYSDLSCSFNGFAFSKNGTDTSKPSASDSANP